MSFGISHAHEFTGQLQGYDPDGDGPTAELVSGPSNGTLTFNPDGTFTYTPNTHYVGPDSFTFTWSDGLTPSNTATLRIDVYNTAPVAYDASFSVLHDHQLTGQLYGYDSDGDAIAAQIVAGPSHGTLSLNPDGTFTYAPDINFTGSDVFAYHWWDGVDYSEAVRVNVGVYNHAPIANGEFFSVEPGQTFAVFATENVPSDYQGAATTIRGLLANDWDEDGDSLQLVRVGTLSSHWTFDEGLNAWIFTAPSDGSGMDNSFEYLVTDGIPVNRPYSDSYDEEYPYSASWRVPLFLQYGGGSGGGGGGADQKPEVKLIHVTFLGKHTIADDPDPNLPGSLTLFDERHWLDLDGNGTIDMTKGERQWPVAYTREAIIKVAAGLQLSQRWTGVLWVRAYNPDHEISFPAQQVAVNNAQSANILLTANKALVNTIYYYPSFTIQWQISFDNQNWVDVGNSVNPLYVTLADPIAGLLFWTVVHIGSTTAIERSDADSAVQAIWETFASRQIKTVHDRGPLRYWGVDDMSKLGFDTASLLRQGDGACGAWSMFLLDVIKAQGIRGATQIGIFNRDDARVTWKQVEDVVIVGNQDNRYGLLVKDVVLGQGAPFPGLPAGYSVYKGAQLKGSSAQGGPASRQLFPNHAIVKYGGKYYDPSYGTGGFATREEWEQSALAGSVFFLTRKDPTTGQLIVVATGIKPKQAGQRLTIFTDESR
ncbi:hypothetical protein HRbin36_02822 [bacterium HR36]|nr:hypothetical protein HRbin36_02822 [bacterium HR36]